MVTPLMKNFVLIPLIIVIGCILTTGCVGQIKNETGPTVTPTNIFTTFSPFSNATNMSTNITTIPVTPGLNGSLRVSIGGWDADLPVFIDNKSVGIASKGKPLDVMVEEGNHTVKVCAATTCEEENVTINFARQRIVDFEARLMEDVQFAKPTARIAAYYPSGSDTITITVEFINPSTKDLQMTAEVNCEYTYIEGRSLQRVGNVAQGIYSANVKSGNRVLLSDNLAIASGYSYVYAIPQITAVTYR
jgi:hypothetical protein